MTKKFDDLLLEDELIFREDFLGGLDAHFGYSDRRSKILYNPPKEYLDKLRRSIKSTKRIFLREWYRGVLSDGQEASFWFSSFKDII